MSFKRSFSGAEWEKQVSYCRAIRAQNQVAVTGTVALTPEGAPHAIGDGYAQAIRCFEIIQKALKEVGSGLDQVYRTRMYVTDISRWEEFGRAHGEVFRNNPPATTMVEVTALIRPEFLIEIEADALTEQA